eukprot:GHRR01015216.1.p2 GENE.GHRR01015216.1~~GHRR01015216.1.p2  ORF type:complete len:216 (+),score=57.80 GHRR01015216.1:1484-2131(+)
MADIILLNKADLVEEGYLSELQGRLRVVNGLAPIIATSRAAVQLKDLLGLRGFELEKVEDDLEAAEKRAKFSSENPQHVCGPDCDHEQDHHHHEHEHSHAQSHAEASTIAGHSHDHTHGHDHHHHDHDHAHEDEHGDECGPGCNHPDHSHSHEHIHSHKPLHNDKVRSLSLRYEGDLDLDKVSWHAMQIVLVVTRVVLLLLPRPLLPHAAPAAYA